MFGSNTYEDDIKNFKKISSTEALALLEKEDLAVIYIGRESCPFCRKFAKKLGSLDNKINSTIYYINSEDFSDDSILEFREKYNIKTVPGFVVKKQGELEVRCDSSLLEDEILSLAN